MSRLADGLYLDVNDAFLGMFGLRREQVIGRTSTDIGIWGDPRDRERFVQVLREPGGGDAARRPRRAPAAGRRLSLVGRGRDGWPAALRPARDTGGGPVGADARLRDLGRRRPARSGMARSAP
ncbi:MAG TPA: PAS domain-containing protein, partial [Arachnia sp.]|nr:PAS domain-containing protein [Arachnia sp.]